MYRKFTSSHIFTGYRLLDDDYALITDLKGTVVDLLPLAEAGDGVERVDGILSPGFINAHCHLELSHMKGHIPEKTGLVDFVLKVVNDRHFSSEEIQTAIAAAEEEMLQNGIVAVGDICNNTSTLQQKKKQRLQYYNFIEATGFSPAVEEARFIRSKDFYHQFAEYFPQSSIVPHAPYSVAPGLFNRINAVAAGKTISMHNQETAAENELFQSGTGHFIGMYQQMNIDISFFQPSGKSSLQTVLSSLNNYHTLLLVHNVYTDAADIQLAAAQSGSLYYCLCPNANLYITGLLPDVQLLMDHQCNMVLGTDSLASNHQLSILEEMKTLQQHFTFLPVQTLLQWATINGARALQMDERLGSFEKGKQPGLVVINGISNERLTASSAVQRIL